MACHAHVRPGRRLLLRVDEHIADRGPTVALVAGCALVLLIWLVDLLTGPRVSLSLFYLVPVAVVTWRLGRLSGAVVAIASSIAWMIADLRGGLYSGHSLVPY
jgi:hypothetical protein